MTFYQELQLSSTGSKQLIKNTTDKKEKRRHILIYNFKVYLVMVFCVAVVTLYSKLTGSENSVVGVTVLLAVLVLRQADFGIKTTHGLLSIAGIFGILIAGPRLSNMLSPIPAFFVNVFCIMLLMILGCHNVIMYNHSTFVLGYLLLLGYDVTGAEYIKRVEGLAVGMVLCMFIFYKNQKNRPYRRTFHSDRGWAYQMGAYSSVLKENKIFQSMSRKGNCYDNSVMETFFGRLKTEIYYGFETEYSSFNAFAVAIEEYIKYYNNRRIQKKTKWMPPVKYREASMCLG